MNFNYYNTLSKTQDFSKVGTENIKYIPLQNNLFYVDMFYDFGDDKFNKDKDLINKLKGVELGNYVYYNSNYESVEDKDDTYKLIPPIPLKDTFLINNINYLRGLILKQYNIKNIYTKQNYLINVHSGEENKVNQYYNVNENIIFDTTTNLTYDNSISYKDIRDNLRFMISSISYTEDSLNSKFDKAILRPIIDSKNITNHTLTLSWREDENKSVAQFHTAWTEKFYNKLNNTYKSYNYTKGDESNNLNSDYGKILFMNSYLYCRIILHTPRFIIIFKKVLPNIGDKLNYTFTSSTTNQIKTYNISYIYGDYDIIYL